MRHLDPKKFISKIFFILAPVLITLCLLCIFIARSGLFIKRIIKERPAKYEVELVKWFPFSQESSLAEWETKVFKDRVVYRVEQDKGLCYVRATSKAAASALYYRIKLDAKNRRPVISWKWRVEKFPEKKLPESLEIQNEDDFAARVYVIFPALFFTNWKVLEYVWTEKLPLGTIGTSPYSKNIKLIVAGSGSGEKDEWLSEERDIVADYVKAYGRTPEYDIGAMAVMTNTEHTGSSADAMYGDIKLGYIKENNRKGGGL